jgi:uncharacterized membrane protein
MKGSHFLFGEMDMFDQLLLLLVGIVVLLVNLGMMSVSWLAYWPILLIIIAFKEMLQSK